MLVVIGLIVLLLAAFVGVVGVLTNAGASHLLTDNFAVLGYDVTGSTGTLFLYGIVVGTVAGVGLSVLLVGARRAAARGGSPRRELAHSPSDVASVEADQGARRDRDRRDRHGGANTDAPSHPHEADTGGNRFPWVRRWAHRSSGAQSSPGAERPGAKPTATTPSQR